eukprot:2085640-Pyramimonas_sp.AAC.1
MALVGALIAQGEKIGQQNLAALTQYQQKVRQERPTNSILADDIRHCRMQSTHNGEMTKIWIAADPPTLENTVANSLVQLGGVHKHSTPPRNHNARLVQLHLDGM